MRSGDVTHFSSSSSFCFAACASGCSSDETVLLVVVMFRGDGSRVSERGFPESWEVLLAGFLRGIFVYSVSCISFGEES